MTMRAELRKGNQFGTGSAFQALGARGSVSWACARVARFSPGCNIADFQSWNGEERIFLMHASGLIATL